MGNRLSSGLLAAFLFASLLIALPTSLPAGAAPGDETHLVVSELSPDAGTPPWAKDTQDFFPAPLKGDLRLPPDTHGLGTPLASTTASAAPEPGADDTSRFMMGSVAVAVILPESDGSNDPNLEDWTPAETATVMSEIQAGLSWWASVEANAFLTFTYHTASPQEVATSYEPISRPSTDEGLWITEVMTVLGYSSGDYFARVRAYNNFLRAFHGTDWAFTIFVVDSSVDADGLFTDGDFAYAYLGGPFQVMTYDNDAWGIGLMDLVAAHETGHIFWATDEYDQGPTTGLDPGFDDETSGYLDLQEIWLSECIMDGNTLCASAGTAGQIGWVDTDSDGVFDILDVAPETTLTPHADPTNDETPTYTGSATVLAYPSLDGLTDVTINTISGVEFRVDGAGLWTPATASDSVFDGPVEAFAFTVPTLLEGVHTIEVRAWIEVPTPVPTMILDASPATDDLTIDITGSTSLVDPLPAFTASGVFSVSAQSLDADFLELFYSKDGGSFTSYGIDPASPFSFNFDTSLTGGDGTYEFYTIAFDAAGNVETAPTGADASTTVDTQPPISSPNQGATYQVTPTFTVTATALDPGSGVAQVGLFYRKDGGAWTSYGVDISSPYSWNFDASAIGDGMYEFYTIATDALSNVESKAPATESSTTVDTVAPATSHGLSGTAGTPPWYRSAVSVTLSAADVTSGVATTMYRVDEGAWQDYTTPFDVTGEGSHTVEYASIDVAGNTETARSVEFGIDLASPALTILAPGAGAFVFDTAVLITWTASDSVSGLASCAVSVDGDSATSVGTETSLSMPNLRDGPHVAEVSCADTAGNTAEETVSFTSVTTNVVRTTPLGGSWIQILIGAIILLIIVLAVVRWRGRRRAQREQ